MTTRGDECSGRREEEGTWPEWGRGGCGQGDAAQRKWPLSWILDKEERGGNALWVKGAAAVTAQRHSGAWTLLCPDPGSSQPLH